jgi:hypothetical protein
MPFAGPYRDRACGRRRGAQADDDSEKQGSFVLPFPVVAIEARCRAELFPDGEFIGACEKPVFWRTTILAVTPAHGFLGVDPSGTLRSCCRNSALPPPTPPSAVRVLAYPALSSWATDSIPPQPDDLERVRMTDERTVSILLRQSGSRRNCCSSPRDKDPCDNVVLGAPALLEGLAARDLLGLSKRQGRRSEETGPIHYLDHRHARANDEVCSYLGVIRRITCSFTASFRVQTAGTRDK